VGGRIRPRSRSCPLVSSISSATHPVGTLERGHGGVLSALRCRGSTTCRRSSMGSDGTRAWFLVLDSLTPRASLSVENSEALMFLAGESAAVVLHRDLDRAGDTRKVTNRTTLANDDNSFSGWRVSSRISRDGRRAPRLIAGSPHAFFWPEWSPPEAACLSYFGTFSANVVFTSAPPGHGLPWPDLGTGLSYHGTDPGQDNPPRGDRS